MTIFRRKKRRNKWWLVRNSFWPATGWKRAFKYGAYRIRRMGGSANSIAIGVAWGVAVSFTPFYFLHIGLAVLGSWFMGGSLLAAAIGTLFLNPISFPFITWLTYNVGTYFFVSTIKIDSIEKLSIGYMVENFFDILMPYLIPMAVGGVLVGIIVWVFVFLVVRILVSRYRALRIEKLRRNRRV